MLYVFRLFLNSRKKWVKHKLETFLKYMYGLFFSAGPNWGESEVKTEIACSLSQLGLLCSTYILF